MIGNVALVTLVVERGHFVGVIGTWRETGTSAKVRGGGGGSRVEMERTHAKGLDHTKPESASSASCHSRPSQDRTFSTAPKATSAPPTRARKERARAHLYVGANVIGASLNDLSRNVWFFASPFSNWSAASNPSNCPSATAFATTSLLKSIR